MPSAIDNQRTTKFWEPWGPMFNSIGTETSRLSISYSDGVDTRWPGKAIKGPLLTAIECTTDFAGTAANTNCATRATTANGTVVVYFGRGTDPAKIKLSDLTTLDPSISAAARVNSLVNIQTAAGAQQIAYGINGANDYRVITTSANSGADTTAANSSGQDAEYIALAPDSMVVLNKQQAYRNIISGSVTASAPSLNSVNSSAPLPNLVSFTGFAVLASNQWIVGTNVGPYVVQSQFGRFGPLFDRLPPSVDNCRAMKFVDWLGGVIIPLERQTRLQQPGGGYRIGPEAFINQTSPIQGIFMGLDFDADWLIGPYLNRFSGTTYVLAGRPRQPDDVGDNPVSWYCIASLGSTASELCYYSGTDGGRTLPTWFLGKDDDLYYFGAGRTQQWPDDTSYTFSTTDQTLYLTELRAEPGDELVLDTVTLETAGCSSTQTITVKWQADGGTLTTLGTIDKNGLHRLPVPRGITLAGWRHAPSLVFHTGSSSASPYTIGPVRCDFVRRPRQPIDDHYTPSDAVSWEGARPL